jgi:hypothetical protein
MSEPEVVEVQPYFEKDGAVVFGPTIKALPYTHVGFLTDYHTKSLLIMMHNQSILEAPSEEKVPAVYLHEKDLARLILSLQQALGILRSLPESEPDA